MKKSFKNGVCGALVAVFLVGCLLSCKTTPKNTEGVVTDGGDYVAPTELNPIALLSDGYSVYARLPAQHHLALTKEILREEIPNIQDGDVNLISNRLDIVWAAQGTEEDRSKTELIASGSIPSIALSGSLTKSRGWTKTKYSAPTTSKAKTLGYNNQFVYFGHPDTEFKISLLYKDLLGLAADIAPLLDRAAVHEVLAKNARNEWISRESEDILFFITRPQQYLHNLLGDTLTIPTDYIWGSLKYLSDEEYDMMMFMHISSPKTMPALRSMLTLAFAFLGGRVEQTDEETLVVTGVPVTQRQIVDTITRDPVTGEHFKVVNEKDIEEDEN